jgi:GNAT superfamily N-acetyltransferase
MSTTVRRVLPHEYHKYRTHLKALDAESRMLRFAHPVRDEVIDQLCDTWERDHEHNVLFCIENDKLEFVAIGHIALQAGMELAFSVLKEHQGQGMGDKLMSRCIDYCRTHDILHGSMVCLSHNAIIKHLCIKHGIQLRTEYGETQAEITFDRPDMGTYISEATNVQFAVLDYLGKRTRTPWSFLAK